MSLHRENNILKAIVQNVSCIRENSTKYILILEKIVQNVSS